MRRVAARRLNKQNPDELIGALLAALHKQGLSDLAAEVKRLGIPKWVSTRVAFDKYNPVALMAALLSALVAQGRDDVADRIRGSGLPQRIADAWAEKKGMTDFTPEQRRVLFE
jgi:hypothetical protein